MEERRRSGTASNAEGGGSRGQVGRAAGGGCPALVAGGTRGGGAGLVTETWKHLRRKM